MAVTWPRGMYEESWVDIVWVVVEDDVVVSVEVDIVNLVIN